MASEYPKSSSSNKTILLVVGIVGGVLLFLMLACGLLGFFVYQVAKKAAVSVQEMINDVQLSQAAAEAFAADLAAGRVDAAYNQTTKGYQEHTTLKQFREFVDKQHLPRKDVSVTVNDQAFAPPRATFECLLQSKDGTGSFTLQLIKQDATWKVDQVTVPSNDEKLPGPDDDE